MKIQLLIAQVTNVVEKVSSLSDIQNGYQAVVVCVCAICIAWVLTTLYKSL